MPERERLLPTETISPYSSFQIPEGRGAALAHPKRHEAQETSVLSVGELPMVDSMRGKSLLEILDHVDSLRPAIELPSEILELAEELSFRSLHDGLSLDSCLRLLKIAVFLDRRRTMSFVA